MRENAFHAWFKEEYPEQWKRYSVRVGLGHCPEYVIAAAAWSAALNEAVKVGLDEKTADELRVPLPMA